MVEHTAENRGVAGSIPALATPIHAVFGVTSPQQRRVGKLIGKFVVEEETSLVTGSG